MNRSNRPRLGMAVTAKASGRRSHGRAPKNADAPLTDRAGSSPAVLAERVRAVGRAWAAADEEACRAELAALAAEAALLSRMEPLPFGDRLAARMRVASERDGAKGPGGR